MLNNPFIRPWFRSWFAGRAAGLLLLGLLLSTAAQASKVARTFHEDVTAYYQKVVSADGLVNYAALSRDAAPLKLLLRQVNTFDAASASPAERKAFYLNAYNLLVMGAVADNYPLTSVMKVPGFFDKKEYTVAGEKMTLNDLETNKLRKPYADPRIHFALVCGALGCPRLRREAYAPATLDAQLTEQTQRALQDPKFVRVDEAAKKVLISEIFKWYEADFKATGKFTLAYINQYRGRQPIPATYTTDFYSYDWSLNERK